MDKCNSIKNDFHKTPNIYQNLNAIPLNANISNEQQFRLNKINEIKDFILAEIRERELISKNIRKYIASLDFIKHCQMHSKTLCGRVSGHKRILRENQTKANFYAE